MNKGQTYQCNTCNERFHICPDHPKAYKMPCPNCEVCNLRPEDTENYTFIFSEKTAEDLYSGIKKYSGR